MRTAAVLSCLAGLAAAAPAKDKITDLPGYGKPKTDHYSGYLDMATPTQGKVHIHYWLTTSESATPENDPVVLWMNGGPGASSILFGFFGELGPYWLDDSSLANKTTPGVPDVYDNPYAWNKIANVLFIESPANVGYSYCEDPACRWTDTTGAEANYQALTTFFDAFPEYKDNEFFITGESYGGMYVPTLVEQISEKGGINLKGFAVGNGIIGHQDTFPGEGAIHYQMLHNHGFISESQWAKLQSACGPEFTNTDGPAGNCTALKAAASDTAGKFYVYDVYDSCGNDQIKGRAEAAAASSTGTLSELTATYNLGQPGGGPGAGPPTPAFSPYGCGKNTATKIWMGTPAVRAALHVRPPPNGGAPCEYPSCPDYEGNTYKYWHAGQNNTGWSYNQSRAHLLDVYPDLIAKYRTLIFNGDFDACVPYLHNEAWTSFLASQQGWPAAREWESWAVDDQVAGYVTSYNTGGKGNFTFATVKGSGHMVPQYQPKRGYALFESFLHGTAPLYG